MRRFTNPHRLRELMLDRVNRVNEENQRRAAERAPEPPAAPEAPQKAMRYRVTVWATVPITDGVPDMTGRNVEKQIFNLLKAADFDADCEVMDAEEVEE